MGRAQKAETASASDCILGVKNTFDYLSFLLVFLIVFSGTGSLTR
jgi:hypothetical protein